MPWGRFHKLFCAIRRTFAPYAQLFEKLFTGIKVGLGRGVGRNFIISTAESTADNEKLLSTEI